MREYETIDELWDECVLDLLDDGTPRDSRDGPTREILHWRGILTDPSRCLLQSEVRNLDPAYAAAEVLWYLSGTDDITFLERFAPQYKRFAPSGRANGAYGARMLRNDDQIQSVIDCLRKSPDSRQAVITLYRSTDLWGSSRGLPDVPCTISCQYLLRDGKLTAITTMRSNDAWLGLPYDVFWWCTLQRLIAWELGVELGAYCHQVGSMHLYDRDAEKASKVKESVTSMTLASWARSKEELSSVRYAAEYVVHARSATRMCGGVSESLMRSCSPKIDVGDTSGYEIDEPLRVLLQRKYPDFYANKEETQ